MIYYDIMGLNFNAQYNMNDIHKALENISDANLKAKAKQLVDQLTDIADLRKKIAETEELRSILYKNLRACEIDINDFIDESQYKDVFLNSYKFNFTKFSACDLNKNEKKKVLYIRLRDHFADKQIYRITASMIKKLYEDLKVSKEQLTEWMNELVKKNVFKIFNNYQCPECDEDAIDPGYKSTTVYCEHCNDDHMKTECMVEIDYLRTDLTLDFVKNIEKFI